jgi:hypothetical protein|mmetsp:Transcript_26064/g.47101  ORF Transcript_26064/g.47101 Transcript_26064/m.47101 type:complete len:276 (-) Transcript_26064:3-830(-)
MGMITSLKVGYRTYLLSNLLALYDEEGCYEHAEAARKRHPEGCGCINYGGKATVLDAMYLLLKVWEDESNHVTSEYVQQCWRKANIVPASVDINNAVGLASVPEKDKKISSAECDELCQLINSLVLVSSNIRDNANNQPPALDESYVADTDTPLPQDDMRTMLSNWVTIEDNEEMVEFEAQEELNKLDETVIGGGGMESDNDEDAEDDNEEVAAGEENATPNLFQNLMQVKENLAEIQRFASQNGCPREIIHTVTSETFHIRCACTESKIVYFVT